MNLMPSIVWAESGNTHERLEVIDWGNVRYLRFGENGGWQGAIHRKRQNVPVFAYQRAFHALIHVIRPMCFFSFGVGTGTSLRSVSQVHPSCQLFGVDIEESVIDVAIRFFDCPDRTNAQYTSGDGIAFLCHTELTFDVIFVDAYLKNDVYGPCLDPAFLHVLNAALSPSGVVMCNFITRIPPVGRLQEFVHQAGKIFPETFLLPVGKAFTEQNVIGVFSKAPRGLSVWRQSLRQSAVLNPWQRLTMPLRLQRYQ